LLAYIFEFSKLPTEQDHHEIKPITNEKKNYVYFSERNAITAINASTI